MKRLAMARVVRSLSRPMNGRVVHWSEVVRLLVISLLCSMASSFATLPASANVRVGQSSTSSLNVWWFGGTESSEMNQDGDSCELVAVRIERTSANSRRIAGSITVPTPMEDVWAILTDYNRLAIHVPNLVESKVVSRPPRGQQGDGTFRCKLFQKGAQKIVGFEFGASVTMEMTEKIISNEGSSTNNAMRQERMIGFKCVDSFFFTEFDGEWRATEKDNAAGEIETTLDYVVDVRPKGPVPVAALEWRIREDVPTNLRAVKKAAMDVGLKGVLASQNGGSGFKSKQSQNSVSEVLRPTDASVVRQKQVASSSRTDAIRRASIRLPRRVGPLSGQYARIGNRQGAVVASEAENLGTQSRKTPSIVTKSVSKTGTKSLQKAAPLPFTVKWEQDETMAAYLRE